MAHVYHVDQPGAPQAPGGRFNSYIIDILKACLVHGYGSRPAAGWSLVDEGTGFLVLRSGSLDGYVCITEDNQVITVSLAESYEGVVDRIIQGAGSISGSAAGSALPHRFVRQYFGQHQSSSSWLLIADGTALVFAIAGYSGSTPPEITHSPNGADAIWTMYLGSDSLGNFMAAGGSQSASNGASHARMLSAVTSLRDPATGLLLAPNALDYGHLGVALVNPNMGSPVALPVAYISPMQWTSGGVFGRMKGLVRCPDISPYSTTNIGKSFGVSEGITVRTINTTLDIGDGNTYFSGVFQSGEGFLITDNPEFW